MKVFDFNVHLPQKKSQKAESVIDDETKMGVEEIAEAFKFYSVKFNAHFEAANFYLFNNRLFESQSLRNIIFDIKKAFKNSTFSALMDFRDKNVIDHVDNAIQCGLSGIKFHSYAQQISEGDFEAVLRLSEYAESKKIFLCFDASYGTVNLYKYDNLRLIAHIADHIHKVPILILHSGGVRVFDAMLIAEGRENIYLETSFSLNYYEGSSLWDDYGFIYKKLGHHRILYGSDFPYIEFDDALNTTISFLEKQGFNTTEIEDILMGNALSMLQNG